MVTRRAMLGSVALFVPALAASQQIATPPDDLLTFLEDDARRQMRGMKADGIRGEHLRNGARHLRALATHGRGHGTDRQIARSMRANQALFRQTDFAAHNRATALRLYAIDVPAFDTPSQQAVDTFVKMALAGRYTDVLTHLATWVDGLGDSVDRQRAQRGELRQVQQGGGDGSGIDVQSIPQIEDCFCFGGWMSCSTARKVVDGLAVVMAGTCFFGPNPACAVATATWAGGALGVIISC
jgi:hypothetical protein